MHEEERKHEEGNNRRKVKNIRAARSLRHLDHALRIDAAATSHVGPIECVAYRIGGKGDDQTKNNNRKRTTDVGGLQRFDHDFVGLNMESLSKGDHRFDDWIREEHEPQHEK